MTGAKLRSAGVEPRPAIVRILWSITFVLALIGVAIVVRRMVVLLGAQTGPPPFPGAANLDAGFAQHRILTLLHIIPGLLFMLLGPWQFVRTLRNRRPALHRWMGRVYLVAGGFIGVSALAMSPQMAIGGVNETAATTLFAAFFLLALGRAFFSILRGDVVRHREWMIRGFAVGLAVATIRPIVGVFFATSPFTHLTPHEFFGTAFWLGFTLQLMAAEAWIRYTAS